MRALRRSRLCNTRVQKNTSNDGVERAEVLLKPNRGTAQFFPPAWHDYLWVESQPGHGATFRVALPLRT